MKMKGERTWIEELIGLQELEEERKKENILKEYILKIKEED